MKNKPLSCDTCWYESHEERWNDSDYWWEHHCNKADFRKIELDEEELVPDWCPLKRKND